MHINTVSNATQSRTHVYTRVLYTSAKSVPIIIKIWLSPRKSWFSQRDILTSFVFSPLFENIERDKVRDLRERCRCRRLRRGRRSGQWSWRRRRMSFRERLRGMMNKTNSMGSDFVVVAGEVVVLNRTNSYYPTFRFLCFLLFQGFWFDHSLIIHFLMFISFSDFSVFLFLSKKSNLLFYCHVG